MGSRWCLYGYEIIKNKYVVLEPEANVVKEIFAKYINGSSLKSISEDLTKAGIVYFKDKKIWNKNMVSRIIENNHYIGDEEYPPIIERELFDKASTVRSDKGGKKRDKDSYEIQFLKTHFICSECGGKIRRYNRQKCKEKWFCSNECKCLKRIDDSILTEMIVSIINDIIENPKLLLFDGIKGFSYEPNITVIKKENEIKYVLDQGAKDFDELKKKVLSLITDKFDCCNEDLSGSYSMTLVEYVADLDYIDGLNYEVLSNLIKKIVLLPSGSIKIVFANDKVICNEKEGLKNAI